MRMYMLTTCCVHDVESLPHKKAENSEGITMKNLVMQRNFFAPRQVGIALIARLGDAIVRR